MSWQLMKGELDDAIEDFSGVLAYRTVLRSLIQLGAGLRPTWRSKENSTPATMAIFRLLIASRVATEGFNAESRLPVESALSILKGFTTSHSFVIRTAVTAGQAVVPGERHAKVETVRRALQSASDLLQNFSRPLAIKEDGQHERIDVWAYAANDLERLSAGKTLPPPLEADWAKVSAWRNLERNLLEFDASWQIWILWLRYRIFGLVTAEIPYPVWSKAERWLSSKNDLFWAQSERLINSSFAEEVASLVEDAIEEELLRDQSGFGLTFYVDQKGIIDLELHPAGEDEEVRASVLSEVIEQANILLELCNSNSSERVKYRVIQYLDVLNEGIWKDGMLLVMRGDGLRKEYEAQILREEDSDLAPLSQSALLGLEQTVRMHNMLVNSHPSLARLDRMLLSPDAVVEKTGIADLRELASSAKAREILSNNAKGALDDALHERKAEEEESDRRLLREQLSISNMVRSALSFLWTHKKKSVTVASIYPIGHWALANEAIIKGYFFENPSMTLGLNQIFQWLHMLPFA